MSKGTSGIQRVVYKNNANGIPSPIDENGEVDDNITGLRNGVPTYSPVIRASVPLPHTPLAVISEKFRDNESINASGFREGLVASQKMTNVSGQFSEQADLALETTKMLKEMEIDCGTVLADGKIEDYEFAQAVAKTGHRIIESKLHVIMDVDDYQSAQDFLRAGNRPSEEQIKLLIEELNINQESRPEAYAEALKFGKEMNLDLEGHPELVTGLMAVEMLGNPVTMDNMIRAAYRDMSTESPEINAQMVDIRP